MGKVKKNKTKPVIEEPELVVEEPEPVIDELEYQSDSDESDQEIVNAEKIKEQQEILKTQREADTPKTIFVGNLSKQTKKQHLYKLFKKYGAIKSVRVRTAEGKKLSRKSDIVDKTQSLNAYVVFKEESSATKSLEMSGKLYKEQHIRVTMSDVKASDSSESKQVLFIGNLKYSATDEKLYQIFELCGEISYVRTLRDEKGCKGIAYVCFKSPAAAQLGLELNGTLLDDRPIRVQRCLPNKKEIVKAKKEKQQQHEKKVLFRIQKKSKPLSKKEKKQKEQNIVDRIKKGEELKKSKVKKFYQGNKVERTKKRHKLGKGMKMKKQLAQKIAPREKK